MMLLFPDLYMPFAKFSEKREKRSHPLSFALDVIAEFAQILCHQTALVLHGAGNILYIPQYPHGIDKRYHKYNGNRDGRNGGDEKEYVSLKKITHHGKVYPMR